jgi:hypothetical protein
MNPLLVLFTEFPLDLLDYILFEHLDVYSVLNVLSVFGYTLHEHKWKYYLESQKIKKNKNETYAEVFEKRKQTVCQHCWLQNGKQDNLFNLILCTECKKKPKFGKIPKTTAIKQYYLNEKELEEIDCIYVQNPMFRNASQMVLYKTVDVISVFCKKYSTTENNIDQVTQELQNKKNQQKVKRLQTFNEKKEQRKNELLEALTKRKLPGIRNDSKLCEGYINGTLDKKEKWTPQQIAHRMCQMKYLNEYCDFDKWYEEVRHDGYCRNIFDEAEMLAIHHTETKKYPIVFPWEES